MINVYTFHITSIGSGYESFLTDYEHAHLATDCVPSTPTVATVIDQSNQDTHPVNDDDAVVPDQTPSTEEYYLEES
jgi:hypothetical protein